MNQKIVFIEKLIQFVKQIKKFIDGVDYNEFEKIINEIADNFANKI